LILVMLGGLAFVFPVAVYFLILANLNRRSHPVMVSGPWDFSEVLLACSGFLIFGGICVLTGFNERWRAYWLYGNPRMLRSVTSDFWYFWLSVIGLYFLLLLAIAVYLLWRRRLATAIYNIELPTLQDYISLTLERLGLDYQQIDQRYFISPPDHSKSEAIRTAEAPALTRAPSSAQKLMLELDNFRAVRHVTLYWSATGVLRDEIEAELARNLGEVRNGPNPVAKWMIILAVLLFAVMVATLGTILVIAAKRG
jgi:hypothetical protein